MKFLSFVQCLKASVLFLDGFRSKCEIMAQPPSAVQGDFEKLTLCTAENQKTKKNKKIIKSQRHANEPN